jgi:RNA polymerase sigma factor (sigma-70 family)
MIRLLLVDDHAAFRQPLAFMLELEPDFTVTQQSESVAEVDQSLADFDVALIDLILPDGNGIDLVRRLQATNPHGSVLVLTGNADQTSRAMAVEAGAAGLLHKSASLSDIIDTVRRLGRGERLFTLEETIKLLRDAGQLKERDRAAKQALAQLTHRERDVLQALSEGMSDREIAEHLNISPETVRTHMANILHKLGVDSRLEALVFAARHGAVSIK